jgi:hypothetical protein
MNVDIDIQVEKWPVLAMERRHCARSRQMNADRRR